ncbi:hypothetical protein [uncultured Ruminococcus sp.]|uniref:hypothetical protein n=1 Tax=uncultured Ruminococcus sp. TaxID=165186 RepID=UPI0026665991|nr:hypothetical protein [uncultured Ruminococcus sp.]
MINEKKVKLQKVKRILTFIFGIIFALFGLLYLFTNLSSMDGTLLVFGLICLCGGVAMIIWAKKRKKLINDMREFMKILSCDENGCLNSISSATNRPIEEIKNEINKLIKLEFLQGVFIDESCNCLVKGNGEVNLKSRVYTSPQSSSKTESVIHGEENTNDKDASGNQFDDGTILLIDNGASYNKLTKETLTFKSGKEIKEVNVSDIDNAKLGLLGVTITLKDNRQEILPTIPKDKYSTWVDEINKLVKGENNYTPVSNDTINKVKKQQKIFWAALVTAIVLIIGIFTGYIDIGFGSKYKISKDSVYETETVKIENIKINEDDPFVDIKGSVKIKQDIVAGYIIYITAYDEYDNPLSNYDVTVNGSFNAGSKNEFKGRHANNSNIEYFKILDIVAI